MQKYEKRPDTVEAALITESNLYEVAELLNVMTPAKVVDGTIIYTALMGSELEVKPGDYCISHGNNLYSTLSAQEFNATYRETANEN